ncbi:hypothetical protein Mjas_01065 [Methanothermococcus sp. Ax23]|uniref:hypothetical protein n=1 Tax=Methanothermococcus sp. Ax23 TaxID=3156486 RepID=UPI003BA1AF5B
MKKILSFLFGILIVCSTIASVSAISVENNKNIEMQKVDVEVVKNTPTDQIVNVNGNLITYHTNGKVATLKIMDKKTGKTINYKFITKKVKDTYLTEMYVDGKKYTTMKTTYNPIEHISSKLFEKSTMLSTKGIDLRIPHPTATVDIYPDKYYTSINSYGSITIDVDNKANGLIIPTTIYYLRIPEGVEYKGVIDGVNPNYIKHLKSGEIYIVPEQGLDNSFVEGPCTLLLWSSTGLYEEYKKKTIIKVRYSKSGSFEFRSSDSITGAIWGTGDSDYDMCKVNIN